VNRINDAVLKGFKGSECAPGNKLLATPPTPEMDNYVGSYVWKVLAAEGLGCRFQGLGLDGVRFGV
jgi:hypothetical protein